MAGTNEIAFLFTGNASGLTGAASAATGALASVESAASKTLGGLGNLAVGAAKATVALAAIAGGAALAAMTAGVKAAGDLEQAVANISTIKPTIDTSQVFTALNEMSTRVPQTAKEIGDALYDVFSSVNVTQEEGLKLVEQFAKGAVGAQTDAKTFGTAVMGVMNAYGMSVDQASKVSDIFFNTVADGVVTGPQLATSLGMVTQSGKLFGATFEEVGALIVGVTKSGGDAAQNINNLNNLFVKMGTVEAGKGFRELGIEVTNTDGSMRSAIDIMGDLKTKTDTMTESAKIAALQKIFPDMQARAGATVIMDQLEVVRAALEKNQSAAGATEAAFTKMNATFASQWKILENTFTAQLVKIGAMLLPIITPMIAAFSQWLPGAFDATMARLAPLAPMFAEFGKVALGVGRYLTELVISGDYMNDFLSELPAPIRTVITAIGQLGQKILEFSAAMLGVDLEKHNAGWGQLGAVIAAAGAKIAATITTIAGIVKQVLPVVMGFIAAAVPVVMRLADAVIQNLSAAFRFVTERVLPPVMSIIRQTADLFEQTLLPALNQTATVMRGVLGDTLDWLAKTVWPPFLAIVTQTANFWTQVILPTLPAIASALRTTLGETVQWLATDIWPRLLTAASAAWTYISGTIIPALPAFAAMIRDQLGKALDWVATTGWPLLVSSGTAAMAWLTGTAIPAIRAAADWLGPKLKAAMAWVIEVGWPTFVSTATAVSTWIMGPGVAAFTALVGWLGPKISAVVTWLTETGWPTFVTAATAVSTWIMGPGMAAFTALVDWLGPKVSTVLTWLIDTGWPNAVIAATAFSTWVTDVAVPQLAILWDWLSPKLQAALEWITITGWPGLVAAATTVSDWITTTAVPAFTELVAWLGPKVQEATEWITGTGWPALVTIGGTVSTMFQTMTKFVTDLYEKLAASDVWTTLSEAMTTLWSAGQIIVERFWPEMKKGADDLSTAMPPANTVIGALVETARVGAAFLLAFATGVETLAKAVVMLADAAAKMPPWMIRAIGSGAAPFVPGGALLPGLVPDGPAPGAEPNIPNRLPPKDPNSGSGMSSSGGGGEVTNFSSQKDLIARAKQLAIQRGLDPELMAAQLMQESSFQVSAASGAGARGIGQFMPGTGKTYADKLGVSYDQMVSSAELSLQASTMHMQDLTAQFNGDQTRALSAYFAGPGGGVHPDYVSAVRNRLPEVQGVPAATNAQPMSAPASSGGGVTGATVTYKDQWGNVFTVPEAGFNDRANMPGGNSDVTEISRSAGQKAAAVAGAATKAPPVNMAAMPIKNQFDLGLSWNDAIAACGPAAVALFMEATGRTPNVQEVMQIAAKNGWTAAKGMGGIDAFDRTLSDVGVQHAMLAPTAEAAQQSAAGGNVTAISTAGHYFVSQGFNPETGEFNVGATGTAIAHGINGQPGKAWMTAAEIVALEGPINGVIQLVGQVGPAFAEAGTAMPPLADGMQAVGEKTADVLTPAITDANAVLAETPAAVGEASAGMFALATDVPAAAQATADGVLVAFDMMGQGALTSVTELGDGVLTTTQTMAGGTIATVTDMTGQVTNQSATLANGVVLNMGAMGIQSTATVNEMAGTITTLVTDTAGNAIATTTDMSGQVVAQFVTMGAGATTSAQTMQSGVVAAADAMQSGAVEAVTTMASATAEAFASIEGPAQSAIAVMESVGEVEIAAPDVGDILDAMHEIEDAANDAADALSEVTDSKGRKMGGSKSGEGHSKALGKASGGPVSMGEAYLIGEEGPEFFVPRNNGVIIPNHVISSGGTRGSLYGGGGSDIDYDRLAAAIASAIKRPNISVSGLSADDVAAEIMERLALSEAMQQRGSV